MKAVLLAATWTWAAAQAPTGDGARAPVADASLQAVAFMAGHWVGAPGGNELSEEVWTEPLGDSMLGMWRFVADGRVRVMELLTLKAEDGAVVLRFRHFDPRLVAREDKQTPVVLTLARSAADEARFEGPAVGSNGTVVLHYRRPSPDALEATLERGGTRETFRFRRR